MDNNKQNMKSVREYLLDVYGPSNSVVDGEGDVLVFGQKPGEKIHGWYFLCDVREPRLHAKVAAHMEDKAESKIASEAAMALAKRNRVPAI